MLSRLRRKRQFDGYFESRSRDFENATSSDTLQLVQLRGVMAREAEDIQEVRGTKRLHGVVLTVESPSNLETLSYLDIDGRKYDVQEVHRGELQRTEWVIHAKGSDSRTFRKIRKVRVKTQMIMDQSGSVLSAAGTSFSAAPSTLSGFASMNLQDFLGMTL